MQHVLVVDAARRPLMPCRPARARLLLTQGKAAVLRQFPFTIVLRNAKLSAEVDPLRVKIDPGSRTTGIAVVNDATSEIIWAATLDHRGEQVKGALDQRRACRRSRRQRTTRYRPARFQNRRRPAGWLPPSLESRIHNLTAWVARLRRWCPIGAISLEVVRFDTQLLQHPEISSVQYHHGTLAGIEIREYLLLKYGYHCVYCGRQADRWEVDHIIPRSRGGSNRVSNLALSCHDCNQQKGNRTAEEFGFPSVQTQAQATLKDAAAVNSTRRMLYRRLLMTGLPVETASGGLTKWNRTQRNLPKAHWLDAACVGVSTPSRLRWRDLMPLTITAQGWQRRQMCLVDRFGFPRAKAKSRSRVFGFKTGDIVYARVPKGTKAGSYVGRVAVRARGVFNVTTTSKLVPDIWYRHCRLLQRSDGYSYMKGERTFLSLA